MSAEAAIEPVPLDAAHLAVIGERIPVPDYDRSGLTAGIVHIGVGGFHRAHQAAYVDALLRQGRARDWAICGIGLLDSDRRMRDALRAQDFLYTLTLKHADGRRESRVIGSIVDYVYAPDDPAAAVERLASEQTRIVSLTITEGGYNINQITGEFMLDDAAVAADIGSAVPATVFGLVTRALKLRRDRGLPPFTVMSCDNIQGNGAVARKAFSTFAAASDPEFGDWIVQNVVFPNSMVDRITPVTSEEDRAELAEHALVADRWPVVSEPFTQWVLEDSFGLGRPDYDLVGVQLVEDVEPYELMKLRLLNASHQALAYFGYLSGYRYAHEAAADPAMASFLQQYMDDEATPTLLPVPGIDLPEYKRTLIERFSNEAVRDTLARLCAESSDRIPKWLLPVVRAQLATGGPIGHSAAIVASWARYAEGTDEQGEPIAIVDRLRDRVVAAAQRQRDEHSTSFLDDEELFGALGGDERFVAAYRQALDALHSIGARATIESLIR